MRVAILVALALGALPPAPAGGAHRLFSFRDARIVESSGIVASARRDGVFFTHNDSGDSARFFAVDRHGCTIGTFTATGVTATDWEDIARGPGPALWLADIGDNAGARPEVAVHRFAEPRPGSCGAPVEQALTPASFRLAYADGPHDAETLLVQPRTGRLFVITKGFSGAGLFAAPRRLRPGAVNVLHRVASVPSPAFATGGDIAPDGRSLVVRGYDELQLRRIRGGDVASAFARGAAVQSIPAPDAGRQGEGIAYTRAGDGLVTSSEGADAPAYLIPLTPAGGRRTSGRARRAARPGSARGR